MKKSKGKESHADTDLRGKLLKTINESIWSDRHLSMRATGSSDTIRNIRRGASPKLDTVEAILQILGYTWKLVPCGGRRQRKAKQD